MQGSKKPEYRSQPGSPFNDIAATKGAFVVKTQILNIHIENFRCFKELTFLPEKINVLVGSNNIGKTALLEAIYLVLGGASRYMPDLITENDFFLRQYLPIEPEKTPASEPKSGVEGDIPDVEDYPQILIELTLGPLATPEERLPFVNHLEAWSIDEKRIVPLEEDESALDHHPNCVRIAFLAWYDPEEDDFLNRTVYSFPEDGADLRDRRPAKPEALRSLGFLMYRDFRASRHPITLSPRQLFHKLLTAYDSRPKTYERLLESLSSSGDALHEDPQFTQIVNDFGAEIERFMPFQRAGSKIKFAVSNLTRTGVREATQAFVENAELKLPIENYGAGTRSLAALASLTLFARKREHALLAVEEPETFLYPASQRAVVKELCKLATQLFLTTHSPYILDLFEPGEIGVLKVCDGVGEVKRPNISGIKAHSRYYRVLRSGLSEGILSTRAVLVEGESDAPLFKGYADISTSICPPDAAIDLDRYGIAVVECHGVGEIAEISAFLTQIGVNCFNVHDKLADATEEERVKAAQGVVFDIGYKGIEELLATELPDGILREIIMWARGQTGLKKVPTIDLEKVNEPEIRAASKEFFSANKRVPALCTQILETAEKKKVCPATVLSMFRKIRGWVDPPEVKATAGESVATPERPLS